MINIQQKRNKKVINYSFKLFSNNCLDVCMILDGERKILNLR